MMRRFVARERWRPRDRDSARGAEPLKRLGERERRGKEGTFSGRQERKGAQRDGSSSRSTRRRQEKTS